MSFSKATIMGKIVDGPVLRYSSDNRAALNFSVVTTQNLSLQCNCWGKLAENAQSMRLGDNVLVIGTLITHSERKTEGGFANKTFQLNVREILKVEGTVNSFTGGFGERSPSEEAFPAQSSTRPTTSSSSGGGGPSFKKLDDISEVFADDEEDEVPF